MGLEEEDVVLEVGWGVDAVVFYAFSGVGVEEVDAEGVLGGVDFLEEAGAEVEVFFLSDLAFEDGFLDAYAEGFAGFGDAAEAAGAGFGFDGGDVVGEEEEHGGERRAEFGE